MASDGYPSRDWREGDAMGTMAGWTSGTAGWGLGRRRPAGRLTVGDVLPHVRLREVDASVLADLPDESAMSEPD
jgi:hypothetical protein